MSILPEPGKSTIKLFTKRFKHHQYVNNTIVVDEDSIYSQSPNGFNNTTVLTSQTTNLLNNVPSSLSAQQISTIAQQTQMNNGGMNNSNNLVPHSQSAFQIGLNVVGSGGGGDNGNRSTQPPSTPLSHHQALQQQLQKHFANNNLGE